jgi:HlyD family secretion protein
MKTKNVIVIVIMSVFLFSCGNTEKKRVDEKNSQVIEKGSDVNKIVGLASVEPLTRIISLYSDVGGIVEKINYDINSEVKANDVIIVLKADVEESQLEQAKSKIGTQQAMINVAKAQLASLKAKMDNAQVTYYRNTNLLKAGAVTQQVFDDSRFAYESAQNDVVAAEATVKEQEAKLIELQADINYDEEIIERKKIKAPTNGKILSIDVTKASYISPTQAVGVFAPDGPMIAITEIDELFATKVNIGMMAYIRTQGETDTLATGKVYLTSPYLRKKTLFSDDATNMEDRRVREVRVLLDKSDKVLIGSRVECVILLKP